MTQMKRLVITSVVLLSGCAGIKEVAYDQARFSSMESCKKLATMSQQNECMKRVNPEYNQYERQRKEISKESSSEDLPLKDLVPKSNHAGFCFSRQTTGEVVCPND